MNANQVSNNYLAIIRTGLQVVEKRDPSLARLAQDDHGSVGLTTSARRMVSLKVEIQGYDPVREKGRS